MRPDDLPPVEHFANKPHGTRIRYMSGCKCMLCRAANSRYECERAQARRNGDWNGLVNAKHARSHLRRLSRRGVGRREICDRVGISATVLHEIKMGRKTQIRARTARFILDIKPQQLVNAATLIPAGPTRRKLRELLEHMPKTELAAELGSKAEKPMLQIATRTRVTAKTAMRVDKAYALFIGEGNTVALDRNRGGQIIRLLNIIRHIHQSRMATFHSLAATFQTNIKTARRDVAMLQRCGIPIEMDTNGFLRLQEEWCFCASVERPQSSRSNHTTPLGRKSKSSSETKEG